MFGRVLGCYTIYNFFFWGGEGLLPQTEFCQLQNSLCIQVLRSPILSALLHGNRAASSHKLCGVVQGMELRNFCRGRHLYSTGRPSRWASAHILYSYEIFRLRFCALLALHNLALGRYQSTGKKVISDQEQQQQLRSTKIFGSLYGGDENRKT